MDLKVSFVIVNWNTKSLVCQAIDSIYAFEKTIDFEIIVVDNASSDDSVTHLKQCYPKVKVLANFTNLGFAKANNQGIALVSSRYVVLFNSDAYLIEEILPKCLEHIHHFGECILTCRILNPDKSIQYSAGVFPSLGGYFSEIFGNTEKILRKKIDFLSRVQDFVEVDWATGAFIFVETELYKKLGGLNENIFMYGEDVEFCYRAKNFGINCKYLSKVSLVHVGGGSQKYTSLRSLLITDKGRIQAFSLMKGKEQAFALRLIFVFRSLVRGCLFWGAYIGIDFWNPFKQSRHELRARSTFHFIAVAVLVKLANAKRFL